MLNMHIIGLAIRYGIAKKANTLNHKNGLKFLEVFYPTLKLIQKNSHMTDP
jgi:hypothetical protein